MINIIKSFSKKELTLSGALIILVVALCNPFDLFMTNMMYMVVIALLVVVVGLFAGLVVHESITDEREAEHRDRAGRAGYTAGLSIILLGIVVQVLKHEQIDGWLLTALVAMIVIKTISRAYSRRYR